MITLEVLFMSPLDMLIFLFFILVTIQAASATIEYWRGTEEDTAEAVVPARSQTRASLSRTVRTGRPSSVRVTPIKRIDAPVTASSRSYAKIQQIPLKDKGAA
jgi:hypothetical protein